MTHKSRHRGQTIPVGCIHRSHHGEEGYAGRGYHLIKQWPLYKFDDRGAVPDHRNPAVLAYGPTMSLKNSMKHYDHGKGHTITFKCPCGAKKERNVKVLRSIARRLLEEIGPDAFIDIGRL